MTQKNLKQWLAHLETAHSNGLIDMGLDRIQTVKQAMALQPQCPVIVVGGTNGKGSVCAFLTQIYKQAGFKVGTLTSPHLLHFNERIAINGTAVDDASIVSAFEAIEAACGNTSLTYFEYNTLAAVAIFMRAQVDVMVLEVGLGGRLDAVNAFDADVAVVTSVDLDHQSFLGDTIEAVGFEKAGIFRKGKAAICGQNPPPERLRAHAAAIGAPLLLLGADFAYQKLDQQQWSFRFHPQPENMHSGSRARHALPIPALRGAYQLNNAACALAAIECLDKRLPVDIGAIKRGLLLVENPGRFQVLPGRPLTVLDVGHNPHAARALVASLNTLPFARRRLAVFAMLADKDVDAIIRICRDSFDEWHIAPLPPPRGAPANLLAQKLTEHNISNIFTHSTVQAAYQAALSQAAENDRITVFGSFHTVAEVMASRD